MKRILLTILLLNAAVSYGQTFNDPRKLEETIGERYLLLPIDSNKTYFDNYLHEWPNPSGEIPVPASEGGKTIVTLESITLDYHARLTASNTAVYIQYFKNGENRLMHFILVADYEKAKYFAGTTLWLKQTKQPVKITAVALTSNGNAPLRFSYQSKEGRTENVNCSLNGTNSSDKSDAAVFDDLFYTAKP